MAQNTRHKVLGGSPEKSSLFPGLCQSWCCHPSIRVSPRCTPKTVFAISSMPDRLVLNLGCPRAPNSDPALAPPSPSRCLTNMAPQRADLVIPMGFSGTWSRMGKALRLMFLLEPGRLPGGRYRGHKQRKKQLLPLCCHSHTGHYDSKAGRPGSGQPLNPLPAKAPDGDLPCE